MKLHPTLKTALRILKYLLLSLVLLFLLLVGGINLPVVHRGLTSKINSILLEKGIPVNAGKISLLLTGDIGLGRIALIKESGDTIVYAGNVNISVSPFQLLFKKIVINNADIQDVVVNLRTNNDSGQLEILSFFRNSSKPAVEKDTTKKPWDIEVKELHLSNIRFLYSDSVKGIVVRQSLKKANVIIDTFSLTRKQLEVAYLGIENASGSVDLLQKEDTNDKTKTNSTPWKFELRKLELQDVKYAVNLPGIGQSTDVSLNHGFLSLENLDLARKLVVISQLELTDPEVRFRSPSGKPKIVSEEEPLKDRLINPKWTIYCGLLGINNGSFLHENDNGNQVSALQRWMPVQEFCTTIKNFKLSPESSGFNISKLSFSLNQQVSLQSGEVLMQADSVGKARITLELAASSKNAKKRWFEGEDAIHLSGSISGSIDSMQIEKLNLFSKNGIGLDISGSLTHLMKIPELGCALNFSTQSVKREQIIGLASVLGFNLNLPDFSPVTLSGRVNNSFLKPDFELSVKSESGNLNLTGDLDLKQKTGKARAILSKVRLGDIVGIKDLGFVSGNAFWSGGFDPKELFGEGTIRLDSVSYRNVTTRNIDLALSVKNKNYIVRAYASDSSLNCQLKGELEMKQNSFKGSISGNFSVDAGRLKLLPGQFAAQANVMASIQHDADSTRSSVNLQNLVVQNGKKSAQVKNSSWIVFLADSLVRTELTTDFMTMGMETSASLKQLKSIPVRKRFEDIFNPDSVNMINFRSFPQLPLLKLNVKARYDSLFSLFIPDSVFNFDKIHCVVEKNSLEGFADAKLTAGNIKYGLISGFGIGMEMKFNRDQLDCRIGLDSIHGRNVANGSSSIDLHLKPQSLLANIGMNDRKGLPLYRIGAEVLKRNETILLKSSLPEWILNSNKWSISSSEFITYENSTKAFVANIHLKHKDMSIDMTGRSSDNIQFNFDKVLISMLFPPELIPYMPDGILSARVTYKDGTKRYLDYNFDVSQMKWEDILINKIKGAGKLKADTTGILESDLAIQVNDSAAIKINYGSDTIVPGRTLHSTFTDIPALLLEPLFKNYVNRLHGYGSGELTLGRSDNKFSIDGEIRTKQVSLNVIPLNAWFNFPDDKIVVKENKLYFNQFTVLDSAKNSLEINGSVFFDNTRNPNADLKIALNNLRVMNTSVKDNPVFSGKIFVNSNIDVTGPLFNPTIKGNILLGNGTNITYRQIQDLNVKENQKTVTFAKLSGNQIVSDKKTIATKQTDLSGLPTIQATIEINPKSNFNVEVSKGFDLGVHISGGGMLNYSMMPNKLTSLAGSYEISKGTAELKFTGWPMKYFAITSGSTFRWDGSMEDPELNLEATSKVKGTYLNPIDNKNRNVDFIVSLKLTDQFSRLKIQFGIKSPDSYIMSVLNSLSPDELMRQAVNLLLFEAIDLPQIQSSTSYMSATIAGFWESQLNSFTKSSFKKVDLSFGIDTRTQTSSTGAQEEKTNLTYSLERKMLKDRASVKVSGRLNEDNTAGAPTNNMIENFSFEYALDSLSTKFLKIYRKQDYQNILEGEIIKSGVGYLYHKNYVRLKDIWRRPDKKKNESVNQPANN